MKKIIFTLLTLFLVSLNINFVLAKEKKDEIYIVEKGDCIYTIATRHFRLSWPQVNPETRQRHLIHPGEEIRLEDLVGSNPIAHQSGPGGVWLFKFQSFRRYPILSKKQLARDRKGLKILGIPKEEAEKIISIHIQAVAKKKQTGFRWERIKNGDRFDKVLFGKGDFFLRQDVLVTWQEVQEAARVYPLSSGNELWSPLIDGNWAIKKPSPKEKTPLPLEKEEVRVAQEKIELRKLEMPESKIEIIRLPLRLTSKIKVRDNQKGILLTIVNPQLVLQSGETKKAATKVKLFSGLLKERRGDAWFAFEEVRDNRVTVLIPNWAKPQGTPLKERIWGTAQSADGCIGPLYLNPKDAWVCYQKEGKPSTFIGLAIYPDKPTQPLSFPKQTKVSVDWHPGLDRLLE